MTRSRRAPLPPPAPQPELPKRKMLTVPEVAAILGVTKNTLYNHVARGTCPFPVQRVGKRVLVAPEAVEAFRLGNEAA